MFKLSSVAVPTLLGFAGGIVSNQFTSDAVVQAEEQKDQLDNTVTHDLLRTHKLEVVTQDGEALLTLASGSSEHSKSAAIVLGVSDDGSNDKSPRNDYGHMSMAYTWSDGTREPIESPPSARVEFHMSGKKLEPRFRGRQTMGMSTTGLSFSSEWLRLDQDGEPMGDPFWDSLRIEPHVLSMKRNGLTNVYLGYEQDTAAPRLDLVKSPGSRGISAWIPRDGEKLPRIEIRDADAKTVASFPADEDE